MHDCSNCSHLAQDSRCSLRGVQIEHGHWTTCHDFSNEGRRRRSLIVRVLWWFAIFVITGGQGDRKKTSGPMYAIVCEVKDGTGGYSEIPYFDGHRVDTVQPIGGGDTVVRFTDGDGKTHEFPSVADYLRFYKESGRQL